MAETMKEEKESMVLNTPRDTAATEILTPKAGKKHILEAIKEETNAMEDEKKVNAPQMSSRKTKRRQPSRVIKDEDLDCDPSSFDNIPNDTCRVKISEIVDAIGSTYYASKRRAKHPYTNSSLRGSKKAKLSASSKSDKRQQRKAVDLLDARDGASFLGSLMLPIRKQQAIELWTPKEIATFESSICLFGKDFGQIQKYLPDKTVHDVIEFYYHWKKSDHYKIWKITSEN